MKVEVPFELVAPDQNSLWSASTQQGICRTDRAGRSDAVAIGAARSRHFATLAGLRQNRFRQIDVPARADHQRGLALQPGRSRVLPDRLQERRRVQDVRHPSVAARPGDRDRERAGVRPERAGAARRRAAPPRRFVPRGRRAGFARLPRRSARRANAPHAVGGRRISRAVCRRRQAIAGCRAVARPPGAARPRVRHSRAAWVRKRSAARIRSPAARWARWPFASRCSAARPTPPDSQRRAQHGRPLPQPARARRFTTIKTACWPAIIRSRSCGSPRVAADRLLAAD